MLSKLCSYRPSHAVVVAYLALFVALGGTAYAAATITSADIVDGQVKTVDLGDAAVTERKIADGKVTSNKVTDNNLRSRDVLNDSLTGEDINESSLTVGSLRGPPGPPGISGYSFTHVESATDSVSPKSVPLDCAPGKNVISAWWDVSGGTAGAPPDQLKKVLVDQVVPTDASGVIRLDPPTSVRLQAFENEPITGTWSVRLGVICAEVQT